ncbi:MAG: hypothetical protein EXR71_14095 [Myxococcales bacterium]|nr:hypothetical protein [Myxococcales bacterium]
MRTWARRAAEGLLAALVVHSAGILDRDGAGKVMEDATSRAPNVRHAWADSGYAGRGVAHLQSTGWTVDVVRRNNERGRGQWRTAQMPMFTAPSGFERVRRQWVVERSFAWLGRFRRLSKECDHSIQSAEAWLGIAGLRNLVRRLAHPCFANTL